VKKKVSSPKLVSFLCRLRPLLILVRLVDAVKLKWDAKGFGLKAQEAPLKTDQYIQKLMGLYLSKDSLQDVVGDCDELFKDYKERMLQCTSVEEFFQDMGLLEGIAKQKQSVDAFVMAHFQ